MFDKEAIEALQYGGGIKEARDAVRSAFGEENLVALPDHFRAHDLEKFMPHRRRPRGMMETSSITDFAAYVASAKGEGATVFVSHKCMVANAVLNLGTPDKPGHADDRAKLVPDATAAYTALKNASGGRPCTQTFVAEFIEDWAPNIVCYSDGEQIPIAKAIAAVRNITIEGLRKVEATEQQLSASKSTFEEVKATSKNTLPTTIYFRCVPYHGFQERSFVLRLGIRTTDTPAIVLRIVNEELHAEEMSNELADKVRTAVAFACPVLIGDYTASQ